MGSECLCNAPRLQAHVTHGNKMYRALAGQRYVLSATCMVCEHDWFTTDRDEGQCPKCGEQKIFLQVGQVICPLHGLRQHSDTAKFVQGQRPIKRLPRNLKFYEAKLARSEPFAHSRWNDGEWLTLLGFSRLGNSNGCTFDAALSQDMLAVLKRNNPYDHALLVAALSRYGLNMRDFLREHAIEVKWVKGDVILNGALAGRLFPLIEQIRHYRVLYVGPAHCRGLTQKGFFGMVDFIEPPPTNAHRQKAEIVKAVSESIERHNVGFVGWSSGLASKVFIDEIFMRFPSVIQMDFGSTFDGYFKPLPHIVAKGNAAGSRGYIRSGGHDWAKLLRMNTKGEA